MKILILQFPVGKIGGIKTSLNNLMIGFKKLGIYFEFYNISLNTHRLPEGCLGFEKAEWLKDYYKKVEKFDLIIWNVPCPHYSKSYQNEKWKELFKIDKKQIAFVRDPYYEKYYKWFEDIPSTYKIRIICPWQQMFFGIRNLKAMKKIIPNPFYSTEPIGLYREFKEDVIVDSNNWKLAKRKVDLIKAADKINGKIISFGNQKELPFYLAKKEKNFDLVEHWGWQDREVINNQLKKAKILVDLLVTPSDTTFDHVISEGISRGCVPVTYSPSGCEYFKTIVVKKYCIECLAEKINEILKNYDNYKDLLEYNLSNLKYLAPDRIVKQILDYVEEPYAETVEQKRLF